MTSNMQSAISNSQLSSDRVLLNLIWKGGITLSMRPGRHIYISSNKMIMNDTIPEIEIDLGIILLSMLSGSISRPTCGDQGFWS
jgi:hypothetical protein